MSEKWVQAADTATGGSVRRMKAFSRGFKDGLAGPVVLLEPLKITTREKRGIEEDWIAVGNSLRWAMKHAE